MIIQGINVAKPLLPLILVSLSFPYFHLHNMLFTFSPGVHILVQTFLECFYGEFWRL